MAEELLVDPEALREQVRGKYREVAADPALASTSTPAGASPAAWATCRCGRRATGPGGRVLRGRGQPFSLRRLAPGEPVIDVGSGAGWPG